MDLITVKAADPTRCALWERDPAHPDGEVFVSGEQTFQVALTAFVQRKLKTGDLVEVKTEPKGRGKAKEEPKTAAESAPPAA